MLNKKDPLIDAIQQVMQSNQADRDAVKAVNEKFGIQDRRVLPRERQGEWDAAYKTVLSEGVEALNEDWDSKKRDEGERVEKAGKTIRANRQDNIKGFAGEIAKRHKDDAVTGGNSADDAKKAMNQLYGKNKGDRKAIEKISEEGTDPSKYSPKQKKLAAVGKNIDPDDNPKTIGRADLKAASMGHASHIKEEEKMKGDDPCWKNYKMVGMKKKGGKPVPNCVPVSEDTLDIQEKAPPGAKYERMVKHIKDKMAKGGLTKKEKSISYATAWKAKNKSEDK